VLRYSEGDEHNGYSITGMYYHQLWTNTTDIPIRAIEEGLVPNASVRSIRPMAAARSAQAFLFNIMRAWVMAALGEFILHL